MKYNVIALLAGLLLVSTAHAEEAPMDATHLGLRAFVYNAFVGIKKAEDMPQFPKGHPLTKAELYNGVAAGVRVRGKKCSSVVDARARCQWFKNISEVCWRRKLSSIASNR